MILKRDHGLSNSVIVERVLRSKFEKKEITDEKRRGQSHDVEPFERGNSLESVWTRLDEIYDWYVNKNYKLTKQSYRLCGYDLGGYNTTNSSTWQKALVWIRINGDPRDNRRWVDWCLTRDMEGYYRP